MNAIHCSSPISVPASNLIKTMNLPWLTPAIVDTQSMWIYGLKQSPNQNIVNAITKRLGQFVQGEWLTHSKQVKGYFAFLLNRFIVLSAEQKLGGCAIRQSVEVIQELEIAHQFNALDRSCVHYLTDDNNIQYIERETLLIKSDSEQSSNHFPIKKNTIIFDKGIYTIKQWRDGLFAQRADATWLKRFL